jgi:TatD family-associated radical SAM protein
MMPGPKDPEFSVRMVSAVSAVKMSNLDFDMPVRSSEASIVYRYKNNLYLNLTNKCPCACTFCERNMRDRIGHSSRLWLSHEPSFAELTSALDQYDLTSFEEIVFCGFGEPTEALDVLLETARYLKGLCLTDKTGRSIPIRLDTNGLGNRINRRDIAPDLEGLLDRVSISLNAPDAETYQKLVRPKFGIESWQAVVDFAVEMKNYVPFVRLTTVDTTLTRDEEKRCRELCRSMDVTYFIRAWGS